MKEGMTRLILIVSILFLLLAGSCGSRKSKLDSNGLIPEKEMVSIIQEIYIADGLITLPKIYNKYTNLDSLSAYRYIFESHGYDKETMDKTLKYYFYKKPKKLISIYDQVLGIYSKQESLLEKQSLIEQRKSYNRWSGKEIYSLFGSEPADSTMFDINKLSPGSYVLTFSATLYPDDQSVNPRITVYSYNADSLDSGKKTYIKTLNYIKDGQPHYYRLLFNVPVKPIIRVKGWLYDSDLNATEFNKDAVFEDIYFRVFCRN